MRNTFFVIALLCAITAAGDQNVAPPAGRITGTVSSSTGATVTVSGLVINVAGASISPAGKTIPVGSRVVISLRAAGIAGSVIVDPPLRLSGAVESVGPNSLTVLGTPVSITASTTFDGWAGGMRLTKLSDLAQQQPIEVDAVTDSTGTLTALRIWGLGPTPAAPTARPIDARTQVDGVVQSIDGNIYIIGSTHVITSAQTKVAAGIAKGDKVHVIGMKASNKTVLAASIDKR